MYCVEKAIVFPMSACSSHYKNNASNVCDARRVKIACTVLLQNISTKETAIQILACLLA